MYKRILNLDEILKRKSLFLFGPRQTGKSTYLKNKYPEALYINLLRLKEYQQFQRNSSLLSEVVESYIESENTIGLVIIDEIQKIPELLDEVHHLIEKNKTLRFILTGSSARKLKLKGVNLLGGRASWCQMHPLCFPEIEPHFADLWKKKLIIGGLPSIIDSIAPLEDLSDYIGLYLKEEISSEGLVRSIESFSRFLEFAAHTNAEQINFANLGSDANLPASTVRSYYTILTDTLIGFELPAFYQTKKRKALTSAKFYLFDCGVYNAIIGRTEIIKGTVEYGKVFEQALFLEIKAYLDYCQKNKKIEFWRSTSKFEIDFLVYDKLSEIIAIEAKASENPSEKDFKGFKAFEEDFKLLRKIVVCNAEKPRKTNTGIEIIPVKIFLKQLWSNKIL